MQLRTNRFLKFFAAILFLLELLSPAITFNTRIHEDGTYQALITDNEHQNNLLFSFLMEQLRENEENTETDKLASSTHVFELSVDSLDYTYASKSRSPQSDLSSILTNSQPAIYQLNCMLLI